jgi:hypothetical protein
MCALFGIPAWLKGLPSLQQKGEIAGPRAPAQVFQGDMLPQETQKSKPPVEGPFRWGWVLREFVF